MSIAIDRQCRDLAAEVETLRALVTRADIDPQDATPFHGWRVRDSIGHMVTIDRLATSAMEDPGRFAIELAQFVEGIAPDCADAPRADTFRRIARYERAQLGTWSWSDLLVLWDAGNERLRTVAAQSAADAKVPWFGGSMRVESLLAARHMEAWAYGQDIFDGYKTCRVEADCIRAVIEFGLKTFGFSFANRGEAVPRQKPHVALTAPSGEIWQWGEPTVDEFVIGPAVDFCLVVTQRRHVEDTRLKVHGEIAERWMRIAQCIAGPSIDGPAKKERVW